MKKTVIIIKGTHCNACKMLIEDVSSEIKGINSCIVDFTTGEANIEYDDDLNWDTFKNEVEALGNYKFEIPS